MVSWRKWGHGLDQRGCQRLTLRVQYVRGMVPRCRGSKDVVLTQEWSYVPHYLSPPRRRDWS